MIIDLFSGAGGWDEGARHLGIHPIGIELDPYACATARAAGHRVIRADVAAYPVDRLAGRVQGLLGSPPCTDWSRAGKRAGLEGKTGALVFEVMRWTRAIEPEWIACEQVPDVLPIWRLFAHQLRALGYSAWAGVLNAADYGVPQTRERAILMASRTRTATPPEPSHCRGGRDAGLFGDALEPWVSMAEALGWGVVDDPSPVVMTARNRQTGHDVLRGSSWRADWWQRQQETGNWLLHTNRDQRPDGSRQTVDPGAGPAPSFTAKSGGQWVYRSTTMPNSPHRPITEPASTVAFGNDAASCQWIHERPATTVQGDPRVGRPGHKDRDKGEAQFEQESVRVTVQEAAILQSFPPDYPWQGAKTAQFRQVGNAIPPQLARRILAALITDMATQDEGAA